MLTQDIAHTASPAPDVDRDHATLRVLAAFDGTDRAWAALQRGIEIAQSNDARLTIAGVVGSPPPIVFAAAGLVVVPYTRETLQHDLDVEMQRHLAAARDEIPAAISVTTILLHGRAARVLARLAEQGGYDLVVTAPRHRTRLGRLLHRSVTHQLVSRGNVSVLAVRTA